MSLGTNNLEDERLDPKEFIITRKRKKYKFALFANSPFCFEHDEWDTTFAPDHLELGAGTGLFSVAQATALPGGRFVAVDVKGDRLQKGAQMAEEAKLENIRFLRTRANLLPELLKPHSLESVWVTFPDPFPKKRSAGRRLTHPQYLKMYAQLLKDDGALYFKHDNRDFFCWSLEQLVAEKWHIEELSFDLHDSDLPDDYKILTTYERRWIGEGLKVNFVKARPAV